MDDMASMLALEPDYRVVVVSDLRQGAAKNSRVQYLRVHSPIDRFPLRPILGAAGHVMGGSLVARAVYRYVHSHKSEKSSLILHLNEEVSALLLCRLLPDTHKIFTLHNPPPGLSIEASSPSDRVLRYVNFRFLLRFSLQKMDAVIALSSWIRDYLCSGWGLDSSRVHVLPLSVDTDWYHPDPTYDGHLDSVLYVGRFDQRKNVGTLLEAARYLPKSVRVRFVGGGPLFEKIQALSNSLGLSDRTEFLGRQSTERLRNLYQRSSLLVLPSHLEAYPRVVIEAAACGLPVVLPDLPIYHDFIDQGFVEPYEPTSVQALAEAIQRLIDDSERRKEMGRRARESTVNRNSFDAIARGLTEIYGKIL